MLVLLFLLNWKKRKAYKTKRRYWVRKLYEERPIKGEYGSLIKDLCLFDHQLFFSYFQMTPQMYENLLLMVAPSLTKVSEFRTPVSAD